MAKKTVKIDEDAIRSYMSGETSEPDINAVAVIDRCPTDCEGRKEASDESGDISKPGNVKPGKL